MFRKGGIAVLCLNAAVFIILEVAALAMLRNNSALQDMWLTRGTHAIMANLWGATEDLAEYFSLRKTNDELHGVIYRQEQVIRQYQEMTGRDFSIDTVPQTIGRFRYIPAQVVTSGGNSQHNYVIISRGSEDGIVEQSGIITEQGVVGIIDAVGKHYSYARSFKNHDMTVSARIGKDGAVGAVSWDGHSSNRAIMREVPQHIELHPGDTIYTSGYSSIFPPDIPLGTLGTYRIENGATYEIKIQLFEDFSSTKYVTVVNHIYSEELKELIGQ